MGSKNEQEFTQVGRNVQVNGDIIGKTDIRIAGKVKGKEEEKKKKDGRKKYSEKLRLELK